jgi:cell division protein FtsX
MHVMKSAVVGAASGAVIGGMSALSCLSLQVFFNVLAKRVVNSLAGQPSAPYVFNENTVPEYSILKAVGIGVVLGGLVGLVSAVVTNYFFPPKKDSN